jgi:hypothetical protein
MQESLFAMFCMVYEYFLLTADNEDLYVRQYPFKLEQVVNFFLLWCAEALNNSASMEPE